MSKHRITPIHWIPTLVVVSLALAHPLLAQTNDDKGAHVLNRIGFGGTPAERAAVAVSPAALLQHVQARLNPVTPLIDNAKVQAALTALQLPQTQDGPAIYDQLVGAQVVRALCATEQLNEKMTQFWEAHFNTYIRKLEGYFFQKSATDPVAAAIWFELQDNNYYREHALGNFRDLLGHTIHSPPMRIYLDAVENTKDKTNENLARELLELHTMGEFDPSKPLSIQQNYSSDDIIKTALVLTGLGVSKDANGIFSATEDDTLHDQTAKELFAITGRKLTVPALGTAKGDTDLLLSYLTNSGRTRDFVCRKLMRFFLHENADTDHPAILVRAKRVWGSQGDIRAVLTEILTSSAMLNAVYNWQQISDPLHFTISVQRSIGAEVDSANPLSLVGTIAGLKLMGQSLFEFPSPDGYPMDSESQLGTAVYLEHIKFGLQFTNNTPLSLLLQPHLLVLDTTLGLPTSQQNDTVAVRNFLLKTFYADKGLNPADPGLVDSFLQNLDTNAPSNGYALQLQAACAFIVSMTHTSLK